MSSYVSVLRYSFVWLQSFKKSGWTWGVTSAFLAPSTSHSAAVTQLVVGIVCGATGYELVVPLEVIISGDIRSLKAEQCVRSVDGTQVHEDIRQIDMHNMCVCCIQYL